MPQSKKIMLLGESLKKQELLKKQLHGSFLNSVLVVANNKEEFIEKINWFTPDIIIADFNATDPCCMEVLLYIRTQKPFIPFIFVANPTTKENSLVSTLEKITEGHIYQDELHLLPGLIKKTLQKTTRKFSKTLEIVHKSRQRKINISKAIHLIQAAGNFSHKRELLSLLQGVEHGSLQLSH